MNENEPKRYGISEADLGIILICLKNIKLPVTTYIPEENEVKFLKGIIKQQIANAVTIIEMIKKISMFKETK